MAYEYAKHLLDEVSFFILYYDTLESIKTQGTIQNCGWAYLEPPLKVADEIQDVSSNIAVTHCPSFVVFSSYEK